MTPSGGDYITCPNDHSISETFYDYDIYFGAKDPSFICKFCLINDPDCTKCVNEQLPIFSYCEKCDLFFKLSHTYQCNGCTDDWYFYEYISKFTYKGKEYSGMPKLKLNFNGINYRGFSDREIKLCIGDSEELLDIYIKKEEKYDWYYITIKDLRPTEITCSCIGAKMTGKKASYPIDKYPQYYYTKCKKVYNCI
jgi:hypothetical protein